MQGYDEKDDVFGIKSGSTYFHNFAIQGMEGWRREELHTIYWNDEFVINRTSEGVEIRPQGVALLHLTSERLFRPPFRVTFCVRRNNSSFANTWFRVGVTAVDSSTLEVTDKDLVHLDLGGHSQNGLSNMIHNYIKSGGFERWNQFNTPAPLIGSDYINYSFTLLDHDLHVENYAIDSTASPKLGSVFQQNVPNTDNLYRLSMFLVSHQSTIRNIASAFPSPSGEIRIVFDTTFVNYDYVGYVDNFHGVKSRGKPVRGIYLIKYVDDYTWDLDGTKFEGQYIPGTGKVNAVNVEFSQFHTVKHVVCREFGLMASEITGGRGQLAGGQGVPVAWRGLLSTTAVGQTQTVGPVLHDAARDSSNPSHRAGVAKTSITAVATDDVSDMTTTLQGVKVARSFQIPELEWSYAALTGGIVNTTDVVLAAAAGAGLRRYITSIQFSNTSATATELVLKDGSTVIWRAFVPANAANCSVMFSNPLRTTANTALNVACITTGAAVRVDAAGYTAP